MKAFIKPARVAFCIGLAGMVIPQLFYRQFQPNFFPAWPGLPWTAFWSNLFTLVIIALCGAIVFEKNGRTASLILGGLLLAVYCFSYIPYELIIEPHRSSLGSWADGLKEPALAGGAFIIAGSFSKQDNRQTSSLTKFLDGLIPFGPLFFCITMVLYGVCHLLYAGFVSTLVPAWFPGGRMFWTYFAAVALIGSGITIALGIKQRLAATLLGTMIFIWLFIIHIPLAIADPFGRNSNYLVGAFSALAFSATAFLIAFRKDRMAASGIADDTVIITTEVRASIQDCWGAWTDADQLLKWFGSDPDGRGLAATLDVKVGGSYKISFVNSDQTEHTCSGVYIEVKPLEKLAFYWEWLSEPGVVSLVTVSFAPKGILTWMQLQHAHVGKLSAHDYRIGWRSTFTKLEKLLTDQNAP